VRLGARVLVFVVSMLSLARHVDGQTEPAIVRVTVAWPASP
jgi:hypothetical protein